MYNRRFQFETLESRIVLDGSPLLLDLTESTATPGEGQFEELTAESALAQAEGRTCHPKSTGPTSIPAISWR